MTKWHRKLIFVDIQRHLWDEHHIIITTLHPIIFVLQHIALKNMLSRFHHNHMCSIVKTMIRIYVLQQNKWCSSLYFKFVKWKPEGSIV